MKTHLPHVNWRLIKTAPAPGAWNMAVDEAILEAVGDGKALPTLRLYAWDPPCLSLGYAQTFSDVDMLRVKKRGWDVVRRITGGRAILHTDELTYSVIGPHNEARLAGSVVESYQRLSLALLKGLQLLKLPAQALPKDQPEALSPKSDDAICFEVPSHYEITIAGKKLVGSAQARKKAGVLQHGTLPLGGDLTRITQALVFESETSRLRAAERLLQRATTTEMALQHLVTWDMAADAFVEAFSSTLNITFSSAGLTPPERSRADELVKEKYAHPSWIERI